MFADGVECDVKSFMLILKSWFSNYSILTLKPKMSTIFQAMLSGDVLTKSDQADT